MGLQEKIKAIEEEMERTQKNKKTEFHLGILKARLAKLRSEQREMDHAGDGIKEEGFEVDRFGNARVALVGFPSVGKSSLLNSITKTQSAVAEYHFTTVTCIPGVLYYKEAKIQVLDLPGIIEGASEGKGRGRQVISVARASDMILMILDCGKWQDEALKLTKELDIMGIRLNKEKPEIYITKKPTGGVSVSSTCPLTKLEDKLIKEVLHEYKILHANVNFRGDYDVDDLIDVIEGNRRYLRCVYVFNKMDLLTMEQIEFLSRQPNSTAISCKYNLGYDLLIEKIWEYLGLVRIYTKKPGEFPSFENPLILSKNRGGVTVENCLIKIHKSLLAEFRHAYVWGRSAKYSPKKCGLTHELKDEDVVQIFKK